MLARSDRLQCNYGRDKPNGDVLVCRGRSDAIIHRDHLVQQKEINLRIRYAVYIR